MKSPTPVGATWTTDHVPAGITAVGEPVCPTVLDCWALASGASGVEGILATTDGGASWSLQSAPNASDLGALSCAPGTSDCWAVGTIGAWDGAVIDAQDDDQGWSSQQVPGGVGALVSISCPTALECVAGGAIFAGGNADDGADVVVTTDGGSSWTANPLANTFNGNVNGISCPSTSDCVATINEHTSSSIMISTNGGETWTYQFEVDSLSSAGLTGISCPTTSTCYVVGQSQHVSKFGAVIAVTTDGGVHWSGETPPAGASTIGLDGISCPTISNCWTSDGGSLFKTTTSSFFETTDGGSTWSAAGPSVPDGNFSAPTCPDGSTCVAGGTLPGSSQRGLVASTLDAEGLGCDGTLPVGEAAGLAADPDGGGYWLASTGGGVVACGTSTFYGSLPVEQKTPSAPIVAITAATGGNGYYLLARDGAVYGFGPGATVSGSGPPAAAPYVGMAVDGGYWLVSADGGVFSFGVPYRGSLPGLGIRVHDIVGIAADTTTEGYWLVGADGGVFSFRAPFRGSLPGLGVHVDDITAMTGGPGDVQDYYLFGSDGGVFAFGSGLTFCGSAAGRISSPVVAAAVYPLGGYWLIGRDGAIYGFDSPDDGSAWSPSGLHTPIC